MILLSAQLQAFHAVALHNTVHGAGKELGLTQTGVTQRIRALESSLSTTLFIRSRKGMRLTPEGEALLRYCQGTRDLEGNALAKIHGAARSSEVQVRVSGPTSLMRSRLILAMMKACKEFPSLLLAFDVVDSDSRENELRTGRSQLAVLEPSQVAKEFDSKILKPERYLLVGPKAWNKIPIQEVVRTKRIIDFNPTDQMTRAYLQKFDLSTESLGGRHFVNNNGALCDLIAEGYGYGVLTEEVASPWIQNGQLSVLNRGRVFENRLALAWYPRHQMPDYFRKLIALAR